MPIISRGNTLKTQGLYHLFRLASLLLLLGSWNGTAVAGPPNVAASIRPLHSLAASITRGVTQPELILATSGSPHDYNLRPSEVRSLQQADLVIWIGPEFETFMARTVAALPEATEVLAVSRDLEELMLPAREGGAWTDRHARHDAHEHKHDHDHDHGRSDPHIWLDPEHAGRIATQIAARLGTVDPDNSQAYRDNLSALQKRLGELDDRLRSRLHPYRDSRFIVFHDAYQYFEQRYDLNPAGALAIAPERRPGAKRIRELQRVVSDAGVSCIFAEPQFDPRLVSLVAEGSSVATGILDPLGSDLQPDEELYFRLMDAMADRFIACMND